MRKAKIIIQLIIIVILCAIIVVKANKEFGGEKLTNDGQNYKESISDTVYMKS